MGGKKEKKESNYNNYIVLHLLSFEIVKEIKLNLK